MKNYLCLLALLMPGFAKAAPSNPAQEPLSCWPEHSLLYSQLPETFKAEAVTTFKTLAQTWKDAYKAKVKHANNSLIFDLQNEDGCLSGAEAVSLVEPDSLKDALKECVFTDINANPGQAISLDNREALAADFVKENEADFSFRKLINASLKGDAIAAFNTTCVVEMQSSRFPGYKLYMAGYTHD